MIYGKTEKRIRQYLTFLDKHKYSQLKDTQGNTLSATIWRYGITEKIFRSVPSSSELLRHDIESFPYPWVLSIPSIKSCVF